MKLLPSNPFFLFFLFFGTLIAVSSSHWLFLWIGMELSLFNLVPLMMATSSSLSLESTIKYFLVQLFSSIMLITSMMSSFMPSLPILSLLMMSLFMTSMLTKLSLAPCHFWFPPILSSLSWPMCFLLMTWQKLVPLFLFMFIFMSPPLKIISLTIILSSTISGVSGLNQTQLRPLLAYSSINHMSWTMSMIFISPMMSFSYFFMYSLLLTPLLLMATFFNMKSNNQLFSLFSSNKLFFFTFSILILSLGGLPPLLGFFPKWLTIYYLANTNTLLIMCVLIFGSLINLYYYLMLIFPFINNLKLNSLNTFNFMSPSNSMMWLSLGSMAIMPLFFF
uniref:NADH-ubiquinone oxidoreductase chain 2 n=1 Tax=Siboglinum plumosum TaxID=3080496 RepID=A0AA97AM97_9ANNE|nr:NADH dehydrogenase subunit 2 [Siboglinum plumosum]WNZ34611.1 NADH dehydrogenase subunit 2 [Siboglinum plumosum]